MNVHKDLLFNILKPYSAVLFLNNKVAGIVILAITFLNPSVALSGLMAVLFTVLFAKIIDIDDNYLSYGFYIYNSLLVGMGVGYIFTLSLTSIVLIAIASVFAFGLSFMLNRLFGVYKLPILSLPFSIVTMFVYLASLKYSTLYSTLVNHATMYDISLPLYLSAYFKSVGTIFFLPNALAGMLLILVIFYFSRIIFIMSGIGFYFGVLVHSFFLGSFEQSLHDPYAFNYILVGVALCGIFLLPTVKNFILSLIAISLSVVLTDAIGILFNYYAIPVFTLPFNFTVITFIFILSAIYYKEFNYTIKATPEASLSHYLSNVFRFGSFETKIALPFAGEWSVYQGFDGEWTHKGNYRYAYDFVKRKEGKSYKGEGLHLNEYYCFGESVFSPIDGYVVDLRHDLPDNYIGSVDRINNWGNYIVIRSDSGFYVEISHLMQHSLTVQVGAYVKTNEPIAKCGNSGYSPEPHIHVQVQDVATIGGFTRAFCFTEYYHHSQLLFNTIPQKDDVIASVIVDKSIQSKLLFIIDDTFSYEVFKDDEYVERVTFCVKMNVLGEFFLSDEENNKLYFNSSATQFYFYHYEGRESYLKWLFILMPRIPFVRHQSIDYRDFLPVYLVYSKMKRLGIELLSIFRKDFAKVGYTYHFNSEAVTSEYGYVSLENNQKGFQTIQYNHITLKRI
jgi:urea transporter